MRVRLVDRLFEEVAEGHDRQDEAEGYERGGEIHAIAHACSHMGAPLSEGKLEGDVVQCPWHGSRFSITDGVVVGGPATFPQPCFDVRVRDGRIEVRSNRD